MRNTAREKAKVLSAGMKAIWPDFQGDPDQMEDVFLRLVEAVQTQGHYIILITTAPSAPCHLRKRLS